MGPLFLHALSFSNSPRKEETVPDRRRRRGRAESTRVRSNARGSFSASRFLPLPTPSCCTFDAPQPCPASVCRVDQVPACSLPWALPLARPAPTPSRTSHWMLLYFDDNAGDAVSYSTAVSLVDFKRMCSCAANEVQSSTALTLPPTRPVDDLRARHRRRERHELAGGHVPFVLGVVADVSGGRV